MPVWMTQGELTEEQKVLKSEFVALQRLNIRLLIKKVCLIYCINGIFHGVIIALIANLV